MCLQLTDLERKVAEEDIVCYKQIEPLNSIKFDSTLHGKECIAVINRTEVEGKISIDNGKLYICHNSINAEGQEPTNKFKYKYAWVFDSSVESVIIDGKEYIITRYETPYYKAKVKIRSTYKSKLDEPNEYGEVEKGLHSYRNIPTKYFGRVTVKCIIPKGSEYYVGEFFNRLSYASNKLKYIKLI